MWLKNKTLKNVDSGFREGRTRVVYLKSTLCNLPDMKLIIFKKNSGKNRGENESNIYKSTLCNLPDIKLKQQNKIKKTKSGSERGERR